MIRHYLTVAFRALLKNKFSSLINILGLAIGITASILVLQYVSFELIFDNFHRNKDRIYRVLSKGPDDAQYSASVNAPLGPSLKMDLPEVSDYTRFFKQSGLIRTAGSAGQENLFREDKLLYADASFLKVFSFPLLSGIDSLALKQPNAAVVTESFAMSRFGTTQVMGKVLTLVVQNTNYTFQITGVAEDVPINSHIQFDLLLSLQSTANWAGEHQKLDSWSWTVFQTYLLLSPSSGPENVVAKLQDLVLKYGGTEKDRLALQPLGRIHLHANNTGEISPQGDIQVVYLLLYVALFSIIIAWINYINLSTVKSTDRAREIGVKKTFGASRPQLTRQFIMEAFLLNLVALVLAIVLSVVCRRYLDQLIGISFTGFMMSSVAFWLLILSLIAIGALASGAYPALVLSAMKPIEMFRSKLRSDLRVGNYLRNGLIVFQFATSMALLISTFTIYEQVDFLRNADLNISVDQVVVVKGPQLNKPKEQTSHLFDRYKSALSKYTFVDRVSITNPFPGGGTSWVALGFSRIDKKLNKDAKYNVFYADKDFFKTYDVQFLAGGVYRSPNGVLNNVPEIVINKTAAQLLGFPLPAEAIDQRVNNGGSDYLITGVIDDYYQESLKTTVEPMILMMTTGYDYYSVRIKAADGSARSLQRVVDDLRREYEASYPNDLFEYFFLDEFFDQKYRSEVRFNIIFGFFSLLAIIVACIGLLGLVAFTVAKRTREVAIRKVMGATNVQISLLLSREFAIVIGIASLIACPIAYLLLSQWLGNFTNRISLSWVFFAVPILLLATLSLTIVALRVLKIARTTPVTALQAE